jgi:hypothetical protein
VLLEINGIGCMRLCRHQADDGHSGDETEQG